MLGKVCIVALTVTLAASQVTFPGESSGGGSTSTIFFPRESQRPEVSDCSDVVVLAEKRRNRIAWLKLEKLRKIVIIGKCFVFIGRNTKPKINYKFLMMCRHKYITFSNASRQETVDSAYYNELGKKLTLEVDSS